jgi:photosystem II oxygen-evolving enhancer protein 2
MMSNSSKFPFVHCPPLCTSASPRQPSVALLKRIGIVLLALISLALSSCSPSTSSLQSYVNSTQGYAFLYPNGWIQVDVKNASEGVDVVFRDLIEHSENLSVIISSIPSNKTLTELGTPTDVGYRLLKQLNANPNDNRETDLISAQSREANGKTYYTLEYQVKLPDNQERHNIASVVTSRNKLFTLNFSTTQKRWDRVKHLFETAANSFSVS